MITDADEDPSDHCHATDVVRGLLCTGCNVAIGLLKDDPVLMLKAIAYVNQYRKGDN